MKRFLESPLWEEFEITAGDVKELDLGSRDRNAGKKLKNLQLGLLGISCFPKTVRRFFQMFPNLKNVGTFQVHTTTAETEAVAKIFALHEMVKWKVMAIDLAKNGPVINWRWKRRFSHNLKSEERDVENIGNIIEPGIDFEGSNEMSYGTWLRKFLFDEKNPNS